MGYQDFLVALGYQRKNECLVGDLRERRFEVAEGSEVKGSEVKVETVWCGSFVGYGRSASSSSS